VVELGDAPFDLGCSELLRRFFAEFEVALELLALVPGGLVEAVVEEADAAEDVPLALDGALVSARSRGRVVRRRREARRS
jgi:hypothetical protein